MRHHLEEEEKRQKDVVMLRLMHMVAQISIGLVVSSCDATKNDNYLKATSSNIYLSGAAVKYSARLTFRGCSMTNFR